MKKKAAKPAPKLKTMSADDHRKLAAAHRAKGHLHEARADLLDVATPPKKGKVTVRPY